MKTSSQYRAQALAVLSGKWTSPVLAFLIYTIVVGIANSVLSLPFRFVGPEALPVVGSFIAAFALFPLTWSVYCIYLKFYRTGEEIKFEELMEGFQDYKRIFITLLLKNVYIFLWTLLLIVPGIIKMMAYGMTEFILKDEPELSGMEALKKSEQMMEGHKMELFLLQLSFIGWIFLALLTCCIGMFWVTPYMYVSMAAFYEDLKAEQAPVAAPVAEAAPEA